MRSTPKRKIYKIDRSTLIIGKADYRSKHFSQFSSRVSAITYNSFVASRVSSSAGCIVFVVNIIGTYICLVGFAFKLRVIYRVPSVNEVNVQLVAPCVIIIDTMNLHLHHNGGRNIILFSTLTLRFVCDTPRNKFHINFTRCMPLIILLYVALSFIDFHRQFD